MSSGQYRYDYANAVNVAVGASSASTTLTGTSELYAISADCNCRFRFGLAGDAALATDPLVTPSSGPFIVRVSMGAAPDTTVYAIGDPATPIAGLLSACPVFED